MHFPNPGIGLGGVGFFGGIFADILAGLVFIICFIVVVGVLFVLIRFLLVATRAAQIYVAKNSADRPTARAVPSAPAASAPATATKPPTAPATAAKPATRPAPRTPKSDSK
jgi:predicted lipid-binding transport protein (Tim44 family)